MFPSRSFVLGPWRSLYQIYQSRSKEGKLGYQNSFRVKQKTTDLQFLWGLHSHVCFQIRRKYAKFLETCYREQSQFLVGTASYRGTTELVDNELGLGGDAVRFFYFGQREGGSELKYYVKILRINWYFTYSVLHNFFWKKLIYTLSYFSRIQQFIIWLLVSVLVVSSLTERWLFLLKHLFLLRKFLVSFYKWFFVQRFICCITQFI